MIEIKALTPDHAEAALQLTKDDFARLGFGDTEKPTRKEIRALAARLRHSDTERFKRFGAFEHGNDEQLVAYVKFGSAVVRRTPPPSRVPELEPFVQPTDMGKLWTMFDMREAEQDPLFLATLATIDGDMGSVAVNQLVTHPEVDLLSNDFYAQVLDADQPSQEWLHSHGAAEAWLVGTVALRRAEVQLANISTGTTVSTMGAIWYHPAPRTHETTT